MNTVYVIASVLIVFASGCTKTVRVPPTHFEAVGALGALGYHVETTDGEAYTVRSAVVRDSMLVLDEPLRARRDLTQYPVEVALERVVSIRIQENDRLMTGIAITGGVASVAAIVTLLWAMELLLPFPD